MEKSVRTCSKKGEMGHLRKVPNMLKFVWISESGKNKQKFKKSLKMWKSPQSWQTKMWKVVKSHKKLSKMLRIWGLNCTKFTKWSNKYRMKNWQNDEMLSKNMHKWWSGVQSGDKCQNWGKVDKRKKICWKGAQVLVLVNKMRGQLCNVVIVVIKSGESTLN